MTARETQQNRPYRAPLRALRRAYWRAFAFCFLCDRHTLRAHRHDDTSWTAHLQREASR